MTSRMRYMLMASHSEKFTNSEKYLRISEIFTVL